MDDKLSAFQIGDRIEINWLDSCLDTNTWLLAEDIDSTNLKPNFVITVGFIVDIKEDYIAIAQSKGNNPLQYSGIITIPRGCIITVASDI